MENIFEAAAITIVASSSLHPYESLFKVRASSHQEFELQGGTKAGGKVAVWRARRKISRGIHAKTGRCQDLNHLDTRAWGLQEKLLLTKIIAFTGAELQWTCRTSKTCECRAESSTQICCFHRLQWLRSPRIFWSILRPG